jgi:hypothetical protein
VKRSSVSLLLGVLSFVLIFAVALVILWDSPRTTLPVWSIGILVGESPLEWRESEDVDNPVLTRDDVTDRNAGFVADPFLIREGGTWYLFCEVWSHVDGQGDIGVATSPDGRTWTYQGIVLDEPHHLSYPQVFAWRGSFWMVPESRKAGELRLYWTESLPGPWRLERTLLDYGPMADPTLFRHEGLWWLLVGGEANDSLHLFFSESLDGMWLEHLESPVVRGDPRGARPAGRVVKHEGRLYRFGQDMAPDYGSAVRAFEILELTTETYRERPALSGPLLEGSGEGWNAERMHHLDAHRLEDGTWIAAVDGRGPP